jgi:hypothetical protein
MVPEKLRYMYQGLTVIISQIFIYVHIIDTNICVGCSKKHFFNIVTMVTLLYNFFFFIDLHHKIL